MNLLSLDVVIGSLCSCLFACRLLDVEITWPYWIVLALSVWIVYTLDHLLDAWRLQSRSHSRRHLFAYRHFRAIVATTCLLLVADLLLVIFFLGRDILVFGSITGALIAVYFGGLYLARGRNFMVLQKELIVAVFYTAGVWGIALVFSGFPPAPRVAVSLAVFLSLAISNALALSYIDYRSDKLDNHFSFAVIHGTQLTLKSIYWLIALAIAGSLLLFVVEKGSAIWPVAAIYLVMAGSMVMLVRYSGRMPDDELRRSLVEGVFWLPGLIVLI